jgi:C4-dicarboxylate-specific signal transduction histidine kinase
MTATLDELRARRRENRRQMKTASPEVLALRQRLEDVLAALIHNLRR